MIARRSILTGLVALVAAPAIVKVSSLMPVNSKLVPSWPIGYGNSLLTIDEITREAVRLFQNSNAFIEKMDREYEFYNGEQWSKDELDVFAKRGGQKIGDVLRIRLPNDYIVSDGPSLDVTHTADAFGYMMLNSGIIKAGEQAFTAPQLPTALGVAALAVAAAPVIEEALAKPVSRRFWSK